LNSISGHKASIIVEGGLCSGTEVGNNFLFNQVNAQVKGCAFGKVLDTFCILQISNQWNTKLQNPVFPDGIT